MSGGSSSAVAWFSRLEPITVPAADRRPDDPRLGEVVEIWRGDAAALRPGRAVLVGFPQDEGVRRNQGRPGAAQAPPEIRRWLYRLTPWDGFKNRDLRPEPPLDAGNVRITGTLEQTQAALAEVIAGILLAGAVPVVLGGGHETAFGHYLGYVNAERKVGILNIDAHLDVRPCLDGQGHSGSPFRQALEHPTHPLNAAYYACLGAQPHSVSHDHLRYVRERGGRVWMVPEVGHDAEMFFIHAEDYFRREQCPLYVSIDADVVQVADMPGVSAPNPAGLPGSGVLKCARLAGISPIVSSFELVEINPVFDRDGQSARWGALLIWQFLMGLADRAKQAKS